MPWNKSRWTFHGFVVSEAKMMLEMHYSPPMSRLALICLTNKKLWQRLVSDADVSMAALLFSQLWIETGRGEDPNMQTEMCRDQTSPRARARDRYFVKTNDRIKMKTVSRDILCWFTSLLAPINCISDIDTTKKAWEERIRDQLIQMICRSLIEISRDMN